MTSDQLLRADEFRAAGYWGDDTLPAIVDRWADDDPERPFLSDGTGALTYGEFRDRAWNLAAALAERGVAPGDRVAVQLPNWNEFFLVYAACARLGAVMIPIIVVYRAGEVGFIVENSGAVALVTCGEFRGFDHAAMAADVAASVPDAPLRIVVRGRADDGAVALDDLLATEHDRGLLPPMPSADDPHLILYSSGTESWPKGCLHTWNTSSFLPEQAVAALGMTREDVMFMPSPVTHALGLTLGVMAPTLAGASVHLLDVFDPKTALERIAEHGCTGTASPAPLIRMMLDAYTAGSYDVSRLRFWIAGPGGETVATGEEGEIRYRGPGRLLEYWKRPDLTAAAIDDDGWWGTGDLGRVDGTGYLRVTGRIKDIIIRGGFNISAREVEEALLAHPAVANVAVIGLPDSVVGERACAVIERSGVGDVTLEQLHHHLAGERKMAVWKVPERIEFVTEWPVTATGKVQKFVLRDRFGGAAP